MSDPIKHEYKPFTTRDGSTACSLCYCPKEHDVHNLLIPKGTRIVFLRTIEEPADDYHPGALYAVKGDHGVVTGHGCREGHWVKWDKWPHAFGAELGVDFEPIQGGGA